MKTKAVRLHGANDLRLDEFDLPELRDDEILARVVSDSICMSSYKLAIQGEKHKRVRHDLSKDPIIVGHELCGVIEKVGSEWADRFSPGQKFTVQPALNYEGTLWAPGYSYKYMGGCATHIVIPREVMESDCLLVYEGDAYFMGSLAEPVSCIVRAFHSQYHTPGGTFEHKMGIIDGGSMAILAGVGPMGLGAIDYALNCKRRPSRLVVTDIDDERLKRAADLIPPAKAAEQGVDLHYVNTRGLEDPVATLRDLNEGELYDDVFVFAPVRPVVEMGNRILGHDGCLNFFAGPTDPNFTAELNFYDIHYASHHLVGTTGANTQDMIESLDMMSGGQLNPVSMITHIGGLNAVPHTTLNLVDIPGGKKLIYTHKKLDLVAISDFGKLGETCPFYAELARIAGKNKGLWSAEAEAYLLANAPDI